MKYCPNCRTEYIDTAKICSDCEVELVNQLPQMEQMVTDESDLSLVYKCDQLYKAQMIKSNLESAGIKSFILSQKDSSYPGVGDLAVVKLYVMNNDAEAALEFIQGSENSNFELDEE
jgi:hypothetical protein